MDSSRNDDLPGLVDFVVPYLVVKLFEVCCLLLLNIVLTVAAQFPCRQAEEGTREIVILEAATIMT